MIPKHSALIVFTGAVILGIELTASRYMSPMFGSSLYIWGAILSISLICLSIGYALGGKLGENLNDPISRLVLFVIVTALWLGLLPFFQAPVATFAMSAGHILGPIVVTTLLFALPLTLLASATPLVFAEANKREPERSAEKMGNLFAISTLGSVAGALATSYLLIPALGLKNALFALSFLLIVAIAPYALNRIQTRKAGLAALILAVSPHLYDVSASLNSDTGFSVLLRESSRYSELAILDLHGDDSRLLLMDGTSQNWVSGPEWEHSLFEYSDVAYGHIKQYPDTNRNALVLGLGAGTVSRGLRQQGFTVDSVEIDPSVYDLARAHFSFPDDLPVYLMDARVFMSEAKAAKKSYGVIFVDVAGGGTQPAHLFTLEAFELMAELLSDNGVLLINQLVVLDEEPNKMLGHTAATLRKIFPEVRVFNCNPDDGLNSLVNMITVSSHIKPRSIRYRTHVQERIHHIDSEGLRVISDDWNPSELWSVEVNRVWHQNIRDWLGDHALTPI